MCGGEVLEDPVSCGLLQSRLTPLASLSLLTFPHGYRSSCPSCVPGGLLSIFWNVPGSGKLWSLLDPR